MRYFLLVWICGMFCSGCKKKVEDSPFEEATPVFYFKGTIDASPVFIQAGVSNYYMYSFFKQDTKGLYSLFGDFKTLHCTTCENRIQFQINNNQLTAQGASIHVDSLLKPGYYSYFCADSTLSDAIQFTALPSPNNIPLIYQWDFGDSTTSTLANPLHSYAKPGTYNVCLAITYSDGCCTVGCSNVIFGSSDCTGSIIDTAHAGSVQFDVSNFSPGTSYAWNFGDSASGTSNVSSLKTPVHAYSDTGYFQVSLTISTPTCSNTVSKILYIGNSSKMCYANFDYRFVPQPGDPFSKVIITWVNAAGEFYYSDKVKQPADSFFQIIDVNDYMVNENNEPTKKIAAKFKCLVSNGTNSIPITDADAIFAISYK
jgi:PKD repeat protein